MGSGRAEQIEGAADAGAALLLAVALGYILGGLGADPALRLALPGLAFFGCFYGLRRLQPRGAFPLRGFTPSALVQAAPDELLLTEADRLDPPELLLDNALTHFGPGSRVVRLFAPTAMPTPGELRARIDRHLSGSAPSASPDASEALFEALAELRRSLR